MSKKDWIVKRSELEDIRGWLSCDRIIMSLRSSTIIIGPTQSGKTVMLLSKARQAQMEGKSYFFVVLSNALRNYIRCVAREIGLRENSIVTYYEWRHKLNMPQADIVLVDDIDTFSYMADTEDYVKILCEASRLFCFASTKEFQIEGVKHFHLYDKSKMKNNNTNLFCEYILQNKLSVESNNSFGIKPQVYKVNSNKDQLDKVFEIISNRDYKDVGILVPTKSDVEMVVNYAKERKIKIEISENLNPSSNMPKLLTYHAARGIHFEDVIMPFLKEMPQDIDLLCRTMKGCYGLLSLIYAAKRIPIWLSKIPKELYTDCDDFEIEDL